MGHVEDFTRLLALSIDAARHLMEAAHGPRHLKRFYAKEFANEIFVGYGRDESLRAVLNTSRFNRQGFRVASDNGRAVLTDVDGKPVVHPASHKQAEGVARRLFSSSHPLPTSVRPSSYALQKAKGMVEDAMHESQMPKPPKPYDVWADYLRDGWRFSDKERRARDRFCGLHSGFRPCCVRFFTTKWHSMDPERRAAWSVKAYEVYQGKTQYVPCPDCVEKRRPAVRLKTCQCLKVVDRGIKEWRAILRSALLAYRKDRDLAAFKASFKRAVEVRAKFVSETS